MDRICHEVRRPLAAIQAYAELLADEVAGSLNEAQRKQVEVIASNTRGLARLVTELHESFEALTQVLQPQWDAHDLESLLFSLAEEYRAAVCTRPLRLTTQTDGPLVHPHVDERLLRSALRRAIDNAIVFGAPGGEVVLESKRTRTGARIAVLDRGPGLDAAEIERAFECFARGNPPPGFPAKGVGLGLPVCRAIVEALGGSARLEPRRPAGMALVMELPWQTRGDDDGRANRFVSGRDASSARVTT